MERKFFSFGLCSKEAYFLDISYDSYVRGNIFGAFKLKDILIRKKRLFQDEIIIKLPYVLYMYEENGFFYEFFSGKLVGKRKTSMATSQYFKPDDEIIRNGYILTSFKDFGTSDYAVRELSAVQFADEVKRYIPYKEHLAAEMSKLLEAIDAEHKRLVDAANTKKNAAIQAEENSQSWLDSIINGR